jgi:hypothetical protein
MLHPKGRRRHLTAGSPEWRQGRAHSICRFFRKLVHCTICTLCRQALRRVVLGSRTLAFPGWGPCVVSMSAMYMSYIYQTMNKEREVFCMWIYLTSRSFDRPWVLDHSREEQGLGDGVHEEEYEGAVDLHVNVVLWWTNAPGGEDGSGSSCCLCAGFVDLDLDGVHNFLEEHVRVVAEAGEVVSAVEGVLHAERLEGFVEGKAALGGESGELEADLDIEHRVDELGPLFGVLECFLDGLLDRETAPRKNDVRHELFAILLEAVGQLDDLGAVELGVVKVLFHGHHVTLDGVAWAVVVVAAIKVTGPGNFLVEALGPLHLQGDDVDGDKWSRGVDEKNVLDHVLGVLRHPRVDGHAARERVHVCIEPLGADFGEVWLDFLDPQRVADGDGDLLVLLLEELLAHLFCLVHEAILVVWVDAE